MNHHDLTDRIQRILEDERAIRSDLYEAMPGQLVSHVDHRVAKTIATKLENVPRFVTPALDEHLTMQYTCVDDDELRRMVDTLMAANTCFAVIGGERMIRFHDRGARALAMETPT